MRDFGFVPWLFISKQLYQKKAMHCIYADHSSLHYHHSCSVFLGDKVCLVYCVDLVMVYEAERGITFPALWRHWRCPVTVVPLCLVQWQSHKGTCRHQFHGRIISVLTIQLFLHCRITVASHKLNVKRFESKTANKYIYLYILGLQ